MARAQPNAPGHILSACRADRQRYGPIRTGLTAPWQRQPRRGGCAVGCAIQPGGAARPGSAARRRTAGCHRLGLAVRRSWRISHPRAGIARSALRQRGRAPLEGAQGSRIRSVEPSHTRCREPKSLTRSLATCHSPPSFPLTPKTLFYKALSRSHRRAHPKRSGRLRLVFRTAVAARSTVRVMAEMHSLIALKGTAPFHLEPALWILPSRQPNACHGHGYSPWLLLPCVTRIGERQVGSRVSCHLRSYVPSWLPCGGISVTYDSTAM